MTRIRKKGTKMLFRKKNPTISLKRPDDGRLIWQVDTSLVKEDTEVILGQGVEAIDVCNDVVSIIRGGETYLINPKRTAKRRGAKNSFSLYGYLSEAKIRGYFGINNEPLTGIAFTDNEMNELTTVGMNCDYELAIKDAALFFEKVYSNGETVTQEVVSRKINEHFRARARSCLSQELQSRSYHEIKNDPGSFSKLLKQALLKTANEYGLYLSKLTINAFAFPSDYEKRRMKFDQERQNAVFHVEEKEEDLGQEEKKVKGKFAEKAKEEAPKKLASSGGQND